MAGTRLFYTSLSDNLGTTWDASTIWDTCCYTTFHVGNSSDVISNTIVTAGDKTCYNYRLFFPKHYTRSPFYESFTMSNKLNHHILYFRKHYTKSPFHENFTMPNKFCVSLKTFSSSMTQILSAVSYWRRLRIPLFGRMLCNDFWDTSCSPWADFFANSWLVYLSIVLGSGNGLNLSRGDLLSVVIVRQWENSILCLMRSLVTRCRNIFNPKLFQNTTWL